MQESFTPNLLPPESVVCVLSDDSNYSKCFYCQERFGNTAEQIWPNPNTKPFQCHECDIKFYKLDHFVDHFTTHKVHGEARQPFLCPTCNKGFENIIAFSQHVTSHMEGKLYACPHCDESFEFESNLIGHQVLHNKKIDSLMKCESCEALFPIENFVADRLNSKELYSCEICLLDNFSDLLELCLHRAVLHPSYTYRCAQCRKISVSSQKQNSGGNGGTLCEGDVESLCNGEDNGEVKNSEEPGDLSDNENLSQALSILGQQAGHENGRGAMLDLGVVCETTTSHVNKNNKKKRKPSVGSSSNTTAATVITNNNGGGGGGHVESRITTTVVDKVLEEDDDDDDDENNDNHNDDNSNIIGCGSPEDVKPNLVELNKDLEIYATNNGSSNNSVAATCMDIVQHFSASDKVNGDGLMSPGSGGGELDGCVTVNMNLGGSISSIVEMNQFSELFGGQSSEDKATRGSSNNNNNNTTSIISSINSSSVSSSSSSSIITIATGHNHTSNERQSGSGVYRKKSTLGNPGATLASAKGVATKRNASTLPHIMDGPLHNPMYTTDSQQQQSSVVDGTEDNRPFPVLCMRVPPTVSNDQSSELGSSILVSDSQCTYKIGSMATESRSVNKNSSRSSGPSSEKRSRTSARLSSNSHHDYQLVSSTAGNPTYTSVRNGRGPASASTQRRCHECDIWKKMTTETVSRLATKEADCEMHVNRILQLEQQLKESASQVSSLTEAVHTRSSDCQQYMQRIKQLEQQLLHLLQQDNPQQNQQKILQQIQHQVQQQQQQQQQHNSLLRQTASDATIASHSDTSQYNSPITYEFGRPRAGFGISKSVVDKYKMIDIGQGLYVHPDDLAVVLSKADGQKMVRKLMNIVFKKEDLEQGATLSPTGKGKLLDQRIVDVMLAWVLMNQSTMWSRGSLRQAINRKLTSYRCRSLKKKHEAN